MNKSTAKEDEEAKKGKTEKLTRNSLGSHHQLAGYLSLTRSRGGGELLLVVRRFLLQALLGHSCVDQLLLEAPFRSNGVLDLLLRSPEVLFESIKFTKS